MVAKTIHVITKEKLYGDIPNSMLLPEI